MIKKFELDNFDSLVNFYLHACLFCSCLSHEASCQLNATAAVWENFGFKPNDRGEPLSFVFFLFYIQMTIGHKPMSCAFHSPPGCKLLA